MTPGALRPLVPAPAPPRAPGSRSVDEAIETLASPDVTVTNQSDKELQLYKLRELDSLSQVATVAPGQASARHCAVHV